MQTESPSASIELDIRQHIQLFSDGSLVAEQLAKKYENNTLSHAELECLGIYFLNTGQGATFVNFCVKRCGLELEIPWAHFASCLFQACDDVPKEIKEALFRGAQETQNATDFARCLDFEFPELESLRRSRRDEFQRQYQQRRQDLLSQVEMLRSQEMEGEEEQSLLELMRLFPKDENIRQQWNGFQERKAIRILEEKLQSYTPAWEHALSPEQSPEEQEILKAIVISMRDAWEQEGHDESLGHDFAMALLQWEAASEALTFLSETSDSLRILWTRLEALLQARHFVALLNELERGERLNGADPESTFAFLYLKALALWGLGHRIAAIEIMEGIANHRPNYRSAVTLLHLWKGGTA